MTSAVVLIFGLPATAQNPQLRTRNGDRFPTIVFTSTMWEADPAYYSLVIDSSGMATYESAPSSLESTGVPYTVEFQVTDRTRREVFNIARQLNFLDETIKAATEYPANHRVRTLVYHYTQVNRELTYTSTSNSDVEEMTSILEGIAETLEAGRKLAYFHAHDPKRLGDELNRIESEADRRRLRELQALAATLNGIHLDPSLPSDVRGRAETLLKRAQGL